MLLKYDRYAANSVRFFAQLDSHKPRKVSLVDATHYTYEYVPGEPNFDIPAIISLCERTIWQPYRIIPDRLQYYTYMMKHKKLRYWEYILTDPITPVVNPHGDLTCDNVIGDTFIDPGECHGLWCREIDEAKLMQSARGWKHESRPLPFTPHRIHWVLLLSHYYRLLKYDHGFWLQYVMEDMRKVESEIDNCNCGS